MKMSFTGSQGQAEPRPPTIAFVRGECHLMVHGAGIRGRLRTTVTELGARHDFFFQNQDPEVQKKKRKKERKKKAKQNKASKQEETKPFSSDRESEQYPSIHLQIPVFKFCTSVRLDVVRNLALRRSPSLKGSKGWT